MGGLAVERLLAVGGSQSAARLATYINAVAPLEGVFDGFIPFTHFGSGASIDSDALYHPSEPDHSGIESRALLGRTTRLRTDLDVPIFVVNSETETLAFHPVRQPDTDRFRFWEVAGAPHGPRLHMARIGPKLVRDEMAPADAFDLDALSPVAWGPVFEAALHHMQRWLTGGPPPPSQPPIAVAGDPTAIERDEHGNARGGVRVPVMEVPVGRHVGAREDLDSGGLMGSSVAFPPEQVEALYPDHDAYVARIDAAARAAVAAGVLLPRDADRAVDEARRSSLVRTR
jgi:hypothetical protein